MLTHPPSRNSLVRHSPTLHLAILAPRLKLWNLITSRKEMLLRDRPNPSWRNSNDRIGEVHDMATFKQFLLLSISVLKAAMCFFTSYFFFVVNLKLEAYRD
jgi:hypothetical protein